jgi:hypothetical protein
MADFVDKYKLDLADLVEKNTLNESNWASEDWKMLGNQINQNIIDDAFNQHRELLILFNNINSIVQRPHSKSMFRIEKKMIEQTPGKENYFKIISDLMALRIYCDVVEIQKTIDVIKNVVFMNKGQIYIRGSSKELPYGSFMDSNKEYVDIMQFIYIFIEKIGYPVEIQIGHKFAAYTFSIDSALRENKQCGKIDLWNKNFYNIVKKYILDKTNGKNHGSKDDIQSLGKELHENNIPEELQQILNSL